MDDFIYPLFVREGEGARAGAFHAEGGAAYDRKFGGGMPAAAALGIGRGLVSGDAGGIEG